MDPQRNGYTPEFRTQWVIRLEYIAKHIYKRITCKIQIRLINDEDLNRRLDHTSLQSDSNDIQYMKLHT